MSFVRSSGGSAFRETLAFVWPDAQAEEVRRTYQLRRFEEGAIERATKLGYAMDIFYNDRKKKRWERLSKVFRARNIRGIVWGPVLRSSHAHLNMPLNTFAAASIGEGFVYPRLPHARFDHFVGMRTALHQLKRAGHRRIGFAIARDFNVRAAPILLASFSAETERTRSGKLTKLLFTPPLLDFSNVLDWAVENRPEVILLSHDIDELAALPLHPSVDWSLEMATFNRLSDTTPFVGIDQRQDIIASHACDLVIEQLNSNEAGVPKYPKVVLVEGEWRGD